MCFFCQGYFVLRTLPCSSASGSLQLHYAFFVNQLSLNFWNAWALICVRLAVSIFEFCWFLYQPWMLFQVVLANCANACCHVNWAAFSPVWTAGISHETVQFLLENFHVPNGASDFLRFGSLLLVVALPFHLKPNVWTRGSVRFFRAWNVGIVMLCFPRFLSRSNSRTQIEFISTPRLWVDPEH